MAAKSSVSPVGLGCVAAALLLAIIPAPLTAAPASGHNAGQIDVTGLVWLVDSWVGEQPQVPPHRQGGVEIDLYLNGRLVWPLRSDESGRWSFHGHLDSGYLISANYSIRDSEHPPTTIDVLAPGWLTYWTVVSPQVAERRTSLTMDLTLWRRDRQHSEPYSGCRMGLTPSFEGGLQALAYALGQSAGKPLECAHIAPNGDVQQATSTGLAFQVAGTDNYSFTDGTYQWQLSDDGTAVPARD